uniref:Transmembrane protein 184A-like n=1 Tax=Nicotiana sylvestris TaxID=4096 RepID=A0A1U7XSC2_NICSY|nr:PREDICTED: transmembrane protein 184A-like [Nicotiana sylvestris]
MVRKRFSLKLNNKLYGFNISNFHFRYEAWVIYNFLSLCLAWVGGPGAVVLNLSGRVLKPNWYLMMCCFPPIPLDGRFIRRCKQGCLQFVILKPILVAVTFILYAKQKYEDGNFSPKQSYLYLTIIYTISYSMALYALVLFYVACRDLLQPFNPVPKFIIIKSVVFLTYWQVGSSIFL